MNKLKKAAGIGLTGLVLLSVLHGIKESYQKNRPPMMESLPTAYISEVQRVHPTEKLAELIQKDGATLNIPEMLPEPQPSIPESSRIGISSIRIDTIPRYNHSDFKLSEDVIASIDTTDKATNVYLFENRIARKKFCKEHPEKCGPLQISTAALVFPNDYSSMIIYERKKIKAAIDREEKFSFVAEVGYDPITSVLYIVEHDPSITLEKAKEKAVAKLDLYEKILELDQKKK